MPDHQMPIMATRIEVKITDEKGNETTWVSDKFDYVEVETFKEPEYFYDDYFHERHPMIPPRISRLSFHIEKPRQYTVYAPHLARGIDQGDIVEEG